MPHDPLIYGADDEEGLVAVELSQGGARDEMVLFLRDGDRTVRRSEPFEPFIVVGAKIEADYAVEAETCRLEGPAALDELVTFRTWRDCGKAKGRLSAATRLGPTAPEAPYLFVNTAVQQHLLRTGRTLFLGMRFEELRRMQVDIECFTSEGYEFCNAAREGDRIIAIAMSDQSGWVEVLSGAELDEAALLREFVKRVQERDPDVIEGHNIFNFDLPYLAARAARHGVELTLGRDGSVPRSRASRFSVGERTISYDRCDIYGRHVVDTLFLVHAYDITHRSLSGFGLKDVAVHFGVAAGDRTYIEGSRISAEFKRCPARVMRYARDDVIETRAIGNLLSRSAFLQVQMLPMSYQDASVRGNAVRIDALLVREYLRQGRGLPLPDRARRFAGGYTDMFVEGIVENVHHCDVRSLYPSLMLSRGIGPKRDGLGVFLKLLDKLRAFRLDAKLKMREAGTEADRTHFDVLQTTFKILINSFYGYLGFSQARFNDFDAAEEVTRQGRELLRSMIDWLREHGAVPVEIDTDGIYYVPPAVKREADMAAFRDAFAASLPEGIEIEFDGEYRSMYSYKMKNYALLTQDGAVVMKGGALRSRGLEPFQREFLEELVRLKLLSREGELTALHAKYAQAIRERAWPIERLAKTETLQDSPATYAAKIDRKQRARAAAYELALASGREYRAGDHVSYYVTGEKKSVAVCDNARLVSEWDAASRDENTAYYLSKLDALLKKFGAEAGQGRLGL